MAIPKPKTMGLPLGKTWFSTQKRTMTTIVSSVLLVGMSVEIIMFFSLLCNVAIMKEHSDRSC